MTGEITDAIIQEIIAMPDFTGGGGSGTAMRKTDFKMSDIGSYGMPFILADLIESEPAHQLLGGITEMNWKLALSSYNYDPDNVGDDNTGYNADLKNVIDRIRQHFTVGGRRSFIYAGTDLTPGTAYTVVGAVTDTVIYNGNTYKQGDYFTAVAGVVSFMATGAGYLMYFAWLTPGMTQILNDYGFRFTLTGVGSADPLDGDGLVMGYKIVLDSISYDTDTSNMPPSTQVVTTVQQINNPPFD